MTDKHNDGQLRARQITLGCIDTAYRRYGESNTLRGVQHSDNNFSIAYSNEMLHNSWEDEVNVTEMWSQ